MARRSAGARPGPPKFRSLLVDILSGTVYDRAFKEGFRDFPEASLRFQVVRLRTRHRRAVVSAHRDTALELMSEEQLSRILGKGHRLADAVVSTSLGQVYDVFDASKHADRDAVYHLAHVLLDLGQ